LQAPEGAYVAANKMPFTDAELNRIYAACDKIGGPTRPGPGHRLWGGEDVKDFVILSVYTGLRISDVATFNVTQRLKGNDVFLRMHKTKKDHRRSSNSSKQKFPLLARVNFVSRSKQSASTVAR
jgi:hypothetical protein